MAVVALAALLAVAAHAAKTLDIYFIDVEGGQSTLIVTPAGESLLVDTGYGGNDARDARRIMTAVRDAGDDEDRLPADHALPPGSRHRHRRSRASRFRSGTFVDHGGLSADAPKDAGYADILRAYNAYVAIRAKGKHLDAKPGRSHSVERRRRRRGELGGGDDHGAAGRRRAGEPPSARRRRQTPPRSSRIRARPASVSASGISASSISAI